MGDNCTSARGCLAAPLDTLRRGWAPGTESCAFWSLDSRLEACLGPRRPISNARSAGKRIGPGSDRSCRVEPSPSKAPLSRRRRNLLAKRFASAAVSGRLPMATILVGQDQRQRWKGQRLALPRRYHAQAHSPTRPGRPGPGPRSKAQAQTFPGKRLLDTTLLCAAWGNKAMPPSVQVSTISTKRKATLRLRQQGREDPVLYAVPCSACYI